MTYTATTTVGTLRAQARFLREIGVADLRDAGEIAAAVCRWQDEHGELAPHGLGRRCECSCACAAPATGRDDGNYTCAACAEYVVDDDGDIHCSRCDGTEWVQDGGHHYLRMSPPDMPEEDPEGLYALYWDTVGSESRAVARFATLAEAEQAAAATDWPRPTDRTSYLCGYEVREWDEGEACWVRVEP